MNLGDSAAWRQRFIDVHTELLVLIAAVWPRCAARFDATARENAVTDQLILALRRDPVARRFLVIPQLKLIDEDLIGDVVTKGFIDIAVFIDWNSECYLAFECKRLNVRYEEDRHSQAGPYADNGLMRFVSAQYARALPLGAMLGYVMDGDLDWALTRLKAAIQTRSAKLYLAGSPTGATEIAALRCFRTRHDRPSDSTGIEVRHALLPMRREGSTNA